MLLSQTQTCIKNYTLNNILTIPIFLNNILFNSNQYNLIQSLLYKKLTLHKQYNYKQKHQFFLLLLVNIIIYIQQIVKKKTLTYTFIYHFLYYNLIL